ncbi:MAG: hydrogenase formation protein HypD [Candidatus Omnitrophica bacterium]|nr:hydrogenase formation protein HypD [Candidatus Omnitrophota bacterium]
MRYVDEYRDLKLAGRLSRKIKDFAGREERSYKFMEVCGTHTNTFFRFGLKSLLPENVRLISGPGCPVCVTDTPYIDNAILLARSKDVIIVTFGDMLKVPGGSSSLYEERSEGRDIRIVYSTLDALNIAVQNPSKKVIFLAVGFETTSPTVALAALEAKNKKIKNFFIYSAHKLIPPAMKALLKDKDARIDGFMLPAHVSTIIGADAYGFLRKARIPGVISGFEPLDMMQGVLMLIRQLKADEARIEIQYNRVVKKRGNTRAQRILDKVFTVSDADWRGLGTIPRSGLKLRREFGDLDAERHFRIKRVSRATGQRYCLCAEILKGKNSPEECRHFAKACTPEGPKGPCMVSSEGSCSIHYKYGAGR